MRHTAGVLLVLLSGCRMVSDQTVADRLDPDNDGIPYLEDCDDFDANITAGGPWYADADGDGFGDEGSAVTGCEVPDGYVDQAGDCDDSRADVHPDAAEICDGSDIDENCNGLADLNDPAVTSASWYEDADGDGVGAGTPIEACNGPAGFVDVGGDCDDTDSSILPGADEAAGCDGLDSDCDGNLPVNERDADGDGFKECEGDCDDSTTTISPVAPEVCDGIDNDCTGTLDDLIAAEGDVDNDGFMVCEGDCDDSNSDINPARTEVCDPADVDEDCSGDADDADSGVTGTLTWYADTDDDGFGDPATSVTTCDLPADHVADDTDCDDAQAAVFPGAEELCNTVDDDCDGTIDEDDATDASSWYIDGDGDGWGLAGGAVVQCNQPGTRVLDDTDCNDGDGAISPGATEIWYDGTDSDCSGGSDFDQDSDGAEDAFTAAGPDCNDTDASETTCGTAGAPGTSCGQIMLANPGSPDAPYWIDPTGSDPFEVVCDMNTQGGGWISLSTNESDDLWVAEDPRSPWYKCSDDAATYFPWLANETSAAVDAAGIGNNVFDIPVVYTRPDTGATYSQARTDVMRGMITQMSDRTRMVAITADDDTRFLETFGLAGQEVYIGNRSGSFMLLTPGEDGDCGNLTFWPTIGSQSGFWLWHSSASLSVVDGRTIPSTDATLTGLPQSYLLPATIRLWVASGGGVAFGWEDPVILVR